MEAILQMTFSSAFSWMKIFEFWLKFHWSLFLRVQLTIFRALVQIMGWCRPGNKPLSEAVMLSLLMHICVTWPQWIKPQTSTSQPSVSYITSCGLVKLYDDIDLRQHWLRQWLVAWWHQAITWTNVHHQWRSVTITWGQFRKKYRSLPSVTKMSLKITYMKFHSNLPGANELRLS